MRSLNIILRLLITHKGESVDLESLVYFFKAGTKHFKCFEMNLFIFKLHFFCYCCFIVNIVYCVLFNELNDLDTIYTNNFVVKIRDSVDIKNVVNIASNDEFHIVYHVCEFLISCFTILNFINYI